MVGIKVLRNDKDCFDQGMGEIRLLSMLEQSDPDGTQPILKLLDYFYFKEHLLIVTGGLEALHTSPHVLQSRLSSSYI